MWYIGGTTVHQPATERERDRHVCKASSVSSGVNYSDILLLVVTGAPWDECLRPIVDTRIVCHTHHRNINKLIAMLNATYEYYTHIAFIY